MKRISLLLIFFLSAFVLWAQNLVPNGDIEQYDTCQAGLGQIYRARFWASPVSPLIVSSPDYFNACNPHPFFSVLANAVFPKTCIAVSKVGNLGAGSATPVCTLQVIGSVTVTQFLEIDKTETKDLLASIIDLQTEVEKL